MTDNVYLNTAFAFMACDGEIVADEIAALKEMANDGLYPSEGLDAKISQLVDQLNAEGKLFMQSYLDSLEQLDLSREDALKLLQVAYKIIIADNNYAYSEVKFFKAARYRLKSIDDQYILDNIPDLEDYWLDSDIHSPHPDLDYFKTANLTNFTLPS